MTTQVLDATTLPPAVRHPRILETFDALAPGEAFVLSNDHYPKPLLYQFQAERENQFDWSVLQAGPTYRVEIRKRKVERPRGVDEYLTWDHNRLDVILDEAIALFDEGSFDEAQKRYADFVCGLERHIAIEEDIVFPVFDARAHGGGPTEVMRFEHGHIREAMAAIASVLPKKDDKAFGAAIEQLVSVLGEHNAKEERVLYPMIDRMSNEQERNELVRRMQAAPP